MESFTYKINDMSVPMNAQPKSDMDLPGNPTNRFNLLLMYLQTGLITKETLRDLQLSDKIMAKDDANRAQAQRQKRLQQKRQKMQQAAQSAALEGNPQMGMQIQESAPPEQLADSPEGQRPIPPQDSATPEPGQTSGEGIPALQNLQGAQGPGGSPAGPTPQEQAQEQNIAR
jgi:hypothetical protein